MLRSPDELYITYYQRDILFKPSRPALHSTSSVPKYGPGKSVFKQWLYKLCALARAAVTKDK